VRAQAARLLGLLAGGGVSALRSPSVRRSFMSARPCPDRPRRVSRQRAPPPVSLGIDDDRAIAAHATLAIAAPDRPAGWCGESASGDAAWPRWACPRATRAATMPLVDRLRAMPR
jgi:hypothetical protein